MTKQEILDAIEKGIAGQGTQVDLGGVLPKVLNAIVEALPEGGGNEPYIVQGVSVTTVSGGRALTVSADEFARAKAAFLAGRVVLIPTINDIAYQVTAYSADALVIGEEEDEPLEGLTLYAKSSGLISGGPIAVLTRI